GEAAVHGNGRACGRRLAGGEEQYGASDVLGGDACLQQVAAAVVVFESGLVEAAGPHAVRTHRGPQAGTSRLMREDGIGRHHVDADVDLGELEAGDAGELVRGRLGGAVGAEL